MVAGPPLGALIMAFLGWPWIFRINIPICAALVRLIARTPSGQVIAKERSPPDWAGLATLALSIGSLAFLTMGDHGVAGSRAPTFIALGVFAMALITLIGVERRHPAPAFDFALFGSPGFVAMCLVPIAGSIGFWALLVHLPQMARGPMGLSAGATSRLLTALTVPMFLLPSLGAKLAAKLPARRYFAGGLAIVGGADLLLALAARDFSAPTAIWEVGGNGAPERTGCQKQ